MKAGRVFLVFVVALVALGIFMRNMRRHVFREAARTARERTGPAPDSNAPAPTRTAEPAATNEGVAQTDCRVTVGFRVMHIGGRVVAVWYPTSGAAKEYHYVPRFSGQLAKDGPVTTACGEAAPLVVFSHGDLGCGIQSMSLTEELARNGYVVAAPDHADAAICHTEAGPHVAQPAQPNILAPEAWDDTSRVDRRRDVEEVIATLLEDAEFGPAIDAQKIGLAGHSLGGYTVVGMAGGWQSWVDARVRAVLALSPYVMPFQVKKTLGQVHVPLMYQGGTMDVGITPFLMGPKGAYAAANAPAYFVELRSAAHLAWANCADERTTETCLGRVPNARLIAQYGVAFFNRHLKGRDEPILEKQNPLLAEYAFRAR
jgi:predicted dienelactone hydrolase